MSLTKELQRVAMHYGFHAVLGTRTLLLTGCLLVSSWCCPTLPAQEKRVIALVDGYLFVDGEYISTPYDIRVQDGSLRINGREYAAEHFSANSQRASPERGQNGEPWRGRRRWGQRMDSDPLARIESRLASAQAGAIVIAFAGQRPAVMYPSRSAAEQLLDCLLGGPKTSMASLLQDFDPADRAAVEQLVAEFQTSEAFARRVKSHLNEMREASASGERVIQANQWQSKITYPLTVFAMLAVVIGFGHLLSHRPEKDFQTNDAAANRSVIVKSLVIIAVLSSVDLIWTISASSAGVMREINPLASHLVQDPVRLACFKVLVTGTSIGILFVLHQRQFASVAAWWCCLLLTLLTARWVVFQSMFV
jgi:hypothetical protein